MPGLADIIEMQGLRALSDCADIICEKVAPGLDKQIITALMCAGTTVVSASPMSREDAVELLGAVGAALAWQLRLEPPDAALMLEQGAARAGRIFAGETQRSVFCD